ncbi:dentin sialophosphoprotein-like [Littorina saxatilis]|uniref:dentin sialophosphoprotein-like n=1 Tax=Littorina saxatilis TaxID=31220 RepID=UPI0038B4B413
MADIPARVILLAMLGSCIGYSIARSVPTSDDLSDDGAGVTHNSMTSDVVRCDEAGCAYDMHLYCLSNGVIVTGSCSLKKTLCTNGVRNELILARGWDACFRSSYNLPLALDRSMVMVYTDKSGDTEEQSQTQDSEPDLKSTDTRELLEAVDDNDDNNGDDDDNDDDNVDDSDNAGHNSKEESSDDDDDNDDDNVDGSDNAGHNSKEESSDDDDDDDDDNVDDSDNAGHNSKKESSVSASKQQKQSQNTIVNKLRSIFGDLSMSDLELGELVGDQESASNPMSETVSKSAKGKQKDNVAMETEKMAMELELLESLSEKDLAKVMDSA